MLQIRLRKQPSESGSGAGGSSAGGAIKSLAVDTVTVACPDHLVLADLPVAKGVGAATVAATFKSLGRRSRRQLGERVHFCVRCDFAIAIYGRLTPCEHAFCLDCARSDSICYLCDERIQKIQTIKMMEGIFVCAAPHCLKSFLKRSDFEAHIHANHEDLLHPNADKEDGNEQEVQSAKQPTPSESRAPPRPIISPAPNPQFLDEEKARWQQPSRQMMQPRPPFLGQAQNYSADTQPESSRPPGFERPGLQSQFQQSMQGTPQRESGQFTDRQQGSFSEAAMPEYPPMQPIQPPNFGMPMNATPFMAPQSGHAPFQPEGAQPFYNSPYEMGQNQMVRTDSTPDLVSEQGPPPMGFPPGPASSANFMANYPQPWSMGGAPSGQGNADGYVSQSDSHGNMSYHRGDYSQNPGGLAPHMLSGNKGMEPGSQVGNAMDPRDGKGTFPMQHFTNVAPAPSLPHPSQQKRHKYFSNDMSHDGQGF